MEFIKTQLQLQGKKPAPGAAPFRYTTIGGGLKWHVKNQGFLSVYRGLDAILAGSIPKSAIRFGVFDATNQAFKKAGMVGGGFNALSGFVAGTIEAVVAVTPLETIKTKLISGNVGMIVGIKQVIAAEGIGGLYKGLTATILKQSSNQALRFFWFGEYKRILGPTMKGMDSTQIGLVNLVGGMTAGCFSTICNNPFDVVKTKMQGATSAKDGFITVTKNILKHEGVVGFYAGCLPRMMRVVSLLLLLLPLLRVSGNLADVLCSHSIFFLLSSPLCISPCLLFFYVFHLVPFIFVSVFLSYSSVFRLSLRRFPGKVSSLCHMKESRRG